MEDFRRERLRTRSLVGYRFSRVRRNAVSGFAFGFALREDALPGIREPPEAVAYAFVEPVGGALYRDLVLQAKSPVRRLVSAGKDLGFPFEFHPGRAAVAVRHRSLARVPPEIFVLTASDFFLISQGAMRASRFLEFLRRATTRPGP